LPRILSILFILFLALFSLDVFSPDYTIQEMMLAFFMHNIPVLILSILLIIAWKYEIVGTIVFSLAGLLYLGLIANQAISGNFEWFMIGWVLNISGPAFLVAYLFYLSKKRKL